MIFRGERSDQSGGGKVRLRFSEGGEERAAVFKENQTVFRGDSGLLFSKEISPCFRGIRGCCGREISPCFRGIKGCCLGKDQSVF